MCRPRSAGRRWPRAISPTFLRPPPPQLSEKTVYHDPGTYSTGISYGDLNVPLMVRWIARGVVHASLVFWIPYLSYAAHDTVTDARAGQADGMTLAGFTTFLAMVWAMQLVVALETLTWTRSGAGSIAFSMTVFYAFVLVYAGLATFSSEFYGVALTAFSRPAHWLAGLCTLGAVVLVELTGEALRLQFAPAAIDAKREQLAGWGGPPGAGPARDAKTETPSPLTAGAAASRPPAARVADAPAAQ